MRNPIIYRICDTYYHADTALTAVEHATQEAALLCVLAKQVSRSRLDRGYLQHMLTADSYASAEFHNLAITMRDAMHARRVRDEYIDARGNYCGPTANENGWTA